jgi:hypothetical protein
MPVQDLLEAREILANNRPMELGSVLPALTADYQPAAPRCRIADRPEKFVLKASRERCYSMQRSRAVIQRWRQFIPVAARQVPASFRYR